MKIRHRSTQSESPEVRRGEAGSRIGTLERQGGSRKGNPVAKLQNLTTQRRKPPRLPQQPKDPNAAFEYWRRPRTLCLKRRNADSKTAGSRGESANAKNQEAGRQTYSDRGQKETRMRKKDSQSNSKILGIGKKMKKRSRGRPEQEKDKGRKGNKRRQGVGKDGE